MVRESQMKAQAKYDKENTRQIMLKLNITSDADILAKLDSEINKQGYIKNLVRKDLRHGSAILSLDRIRFLLLPIVKKYEIKSLSIFGSYARGEASASSDVDILIDGGNYHGLFEYECLIESMQKALGKNVDLTTQASLNNSKTKSDRIFRDNVEKDKVVLI